MVGIGVPVVVPIGIKQEYFLFQDDILVKKQYDYNIEVTAACGVLSTRPDHGCKVSKDDQTLYS